MPSRSIRSHRLIQDAKPLRCLVVIIIFLLTFQPSAIYSLRRVMIFRRGLFNIIFIFARGLPVTPIPLTATPSAQVTTTPQATMTPQPVSKDQVAEEALKGVTIQVWHPWFGVEANLFQSQVDEFNQTNQWGIAVQATGQSDYNELFQNVGASLSTGKSSPACIGLPEYALLWNVSRAVVDLTNYVNDPQIWVERWGYQRYPVCFLGSG